MILTGKGWGSRTPGGVVGKVAVVMIWLLSLSACQHLQSSAKSNPETAAIYQLADQRDFQPELFKKALTSNDVETLRVALLGLGRIGGEDAAKLVAPFLSHSEPAIRQIAALALGIAGEKSHGPLLAERLKQEPSAQVKNELLLALGTLGAVEALDEINRSLKDPSVAGNAAQAIGLLFTWHDAKARSADVDFNALLTLATRADNTSISAAFALTRLSGVEYLYSEQQLLNAIKSAQNPRAKSLLIKTWGRRTDSHQVEEITYYLNSEVDFIVIETLRALASHNRNMQIADKLLNWVMHDSAHIAVTALESLLARHNSESGEQGAPEKVVARALYAATLNDNLWMTALAIDYMAKHQPESAVTVLKRLVQGGKLQHSPQRWFKVKLIKAIHQLPEHYQAELLQPFVKDDDPFVARALLSASEPPVKNPASKTVSFAKARQAVGKIIRFKTNRGEFEITLNDKAIYTAHSFLQWVQQGYYNDTIFSRVIPNFVAQGGEVHGDGSGNVGVTIREEINFLSHQQRTVGIATLGKDTGGAQFFINLAPNLHLDRHYTIFAEVTSSWEVARRLQMGDWVIEATVIN